MEVVIPKLKETHHAAFVFFFKNFDVIVRYENKSWDNSKKYPNHDFFLFADRVAAYFGNGIYVFIT